MNKLGFHLIGKPNEDFESCVECVHANDSEDICVLRLCVHAIKYLYDCYEKAERKDATDTNVGKWINCKYPLGECSNCHAIVDIQNNEANYCPVCGSRNRGEEE